MINTQKLIGPKYFGTSKKRSIFDVGDRSMPGPGTYENHKINIKSKSPQWPLGLDQNRNTFLYSTPVSNPSPQKYKINYAAVEKKEKKITIPRSKQQFYNHTNPQFYDTNLEVTKPKGSQFSFGYYFGNNYTTLPPGPGQYDVQKAKLKLNSKNGFSSSNRPQPFGQQGKNPGIGQYQIHDQKRGTQISFSKASRSQEKFSDPPATFYDISMTKTVLKKYKPVSTESNIQKQIIKTIQIAPAPNEYHCQIKKKVTGGAIDRTSRPAIQNAAVLEYPSCDKYQINISQIDKKRVTFAKQIRRPQLPDQKFPGPKYQLNNTTSNIGAKINRPHQTKDKQFVFPSAADYTVKDDLVKRKAQSSIVFNADRVDFSKTITGKIGPGHYNGNQNYKSTFGKISKASREEPFSPDKNPGVGDYQLPNNIGALPVYCIAPKKLSQTGFSVLYEKRQNKFYNQKMKNIRDTQQYQSISSKPNENVNQQLSSNKIVS